MLCPNCKNTIPDGVRFCPVCGMNLGGMPVQEQTISPAQGSYTSQQPAPEAYQASQLSQTQPGAYPPPQYQKPKSRTPVAVIIAISAAAFLFFVLPAVIMAVSYVIESKGRVEQEEIGDGYDEMDDEDEEFEDDGEYEGAVNKTEPQWVELEDVPDVDPGLLFDYLSEDEQKVYDMLADFFEGNGDMKSITIDGEWDGSYQWERVTYAYSNDDFYSGYVQDYVGGQYFNESPVKFESWYIRDPHADYQAVKPIVDEVVEELDGPDSNKVRQIHDYLCENVEVDTEAELIFDPYGALINHKAACNGYATAFQALCREAEIPCYQLWGDAGDEGNRGRHAWNIVQLEDGNWYEIDVMWDDSRGDYSCFCIPSSEMSGDHIRNKMGGFEDIIPVTQE